MTGSHFPCSNVSIEESGCSNHARFTCKGCFLVSYCGRECQVQDWNTHKKWCKSPLMSKNWLPQWEMEGREPTFMRDDGSYAISGREKYLWGNVPAIDVLQLENNEGLSYDKDLRLLFAASGDPRNIIKTVLSIPASFKKTIEIDINDKSLDIVARNAIMLLVLLAVDDVEDATDTVIHTWYSSSITLRQLNVLRSAIKPLFQDVCDKIENKPSGTVLGKTWTFGNRSLRLELPKESWISVINYFRIPQLLTNVEANEIRTRITLAPERLDFRHRRYAVLSPAQRLVADRFREDGLLLPFGSNRRWFFLPNPTIFQSSSTWLLSDSADPLDGWDAKAIAATNSGPASADQYGQLFYYLRSLLGSFHARVRDLKTSIQLFNVDAIELSEPARDGRYARVEISNICDRCYLGLFQSIGCFTPLLQRRSENPHAVLLMLFMNAVPESITTQDQALEARTTSVTAIPYLPAPLIMPDQNSSYMVSLLGASHLFRDFDKYFDRYIESCRFDIAGQMYGGAMKEKHTIIEKWPYRLKLRHGQPGAQEEFDRVLASNHNGGSRYVEWKRARG